MHVDRGLRDASILMLDFGEDITNLSNRRVVDHDDGANATALLCANPLGLGDKTLHRGLNSLGSFLIPQSLEGFIEFPEEIRRDRNAYSGNPFRHLSLS
jgi:hypothetical protein